MSDSWKVARWEIMRNLKNKSFLISLIITPVIFLLFMTVPVLFSSFEDETSAKLYIADEIGIWDERFAEQLDRSTEWEISLNPADEQAVFTELEQNENVFYVVLNVQDTLEGGRITVYTNEDSDSKLAQELQFLEQPLQIQRLKEQGFSEEAAARLLQGFAIDLVSVSADEGTGSSEQEESFDLFARLIPAAFAGLILFSVVITGMMIFQSASMEKKEKVSEIILSSVTPARLMEGKIIGYFVLGLVQVSIWIAIALPIIQWRIDFNLFGYLFVPELLVLLAFAIAGYFMYAALFVGLGATVEDMTTSGNFQGIVFMIPWIPFMLFAPVISSPEGIVAQVASYVPLTAPGIMLLRLAILEEWPWMEIAISFAILIASIWLFMKLAGKIFKTGILMYGKNATPMEIWKWLRH